MTTSTSNIIVVTNRKIARNDFIEKIKKIASSNPKAIVLREKDLKEEEYYFLAKKIIKICEEENANLILHNFVDVAISLNYKKIHLPIEKLKTLDQNKKNKFDIVGASCHSKEDAINAQKLGTKYIFAGHVYETDCKKGLKGRGLEFLEEVKNSVNIKVYAIGGITPENYKEIRKKGVDGAAIMSSAMKAENIDSLLKKFR